MYKFLFFRNWKKEIEQLNIYKNKIEEIRKIIIKNDIKHKFEQKAIDILKDNNIENLVKIEKIKDLLKSKEIKS